MIDKRLKDILAFGAKNATEFDNLIRSLNALLEMNDPMAISKAVRNSSVLQPFGRRCSNAMIRSNR
jgi:hypothetical protein